MRSEVVSSFAVRPWRPPLQVKQEKQELREFRSYEL